MALTLRIEEKLIETQISVIRRVMRLPKLPLRERHCLGELLRMLYVLRSELNKDGDDA